MIAGADADARNGFRLETTENTRCTDGRPCKTWSGHILGPDSCMFRLLKIIRDAQLRFRIAVALLANVTGLCCIAFAQDTNFRPKNQLIPAPACLTLSGAWEGGYAPCTEATHQAWLKDVEHWRMERAIRTGLTLDDSRYSEPALKWAQSSFIQPQMMVQDRYFYDPVAKKYTVDRYLDDLRKRYGGIDAVLIWPTYPNMGVDDRNQLDMVASMPGGIAGVQQMIADFHRRGVRVLFPMMMWDQGTHDPGKRWPQAIAELMKEIGADGINGDTQDGVPRAFSEAAEKIGHPLAFEPEGSPSDEALAWNVLTWGQYGGDSTSSRGGPFPLAGDASHGEYLGPVGAARRTICSMRFSTAKAGRVGRTSGVSGTELRRGMPRRRDGWRPSSAGLRPFS